MACPTSTFDPGSPEGASVPIELRPPEEVTTIAGVQIAPEGTEVENRAFDVTPAALVTAYITEEGVARRGRPLKPEDRLSDGGGSG